MYKLYLSSPLRGGKSRMAVIGASIAAAGSVTIFAATGTGSPVLADTGSAFKPVAGSSPLLVKELPKNGLDIRHASVTLYQFESCPFCRKARSVLDFAKVPYNVVEVNPLLKTELKSISPDYKKVPILVVSDPITSQSFQVRDSKVIIEAVLAAANAPAGSASKTAPLPPFSALNKDIVFDPNSTYQNMPVDDAWIKWTEAYFLQLVVVNIYGTMEESRETFNYLLTHRDFGWAARSSAYWAGSVVMNVVARKRLGKYTEISGKHREKFLEACEAYGNAANVCGGFLGGSLPSKADLNMYGIIRSLDGTRTLRDVLKVTSSSSERNSSSFGRWYARMQEAVGPSMAQSKANATPRGG